MKVMVAPGSVWWHRLAALNYTQHQAWALGLSGLWLLVASQRPRPSPGSGMLAKSPQVAEFCDNVEQMRTAGAGRGSEGAKTPEWLTGAPWPGPGGWMVSEAEPKTWLRTGEAGRCLLSLGGEAVDEWQNE